MKRKFLFVEGPDPATSWTSLKGKTTSRLVAEFEFISISALFEKSKPSHEADELIVFINGHGNSCQIETEPETTVDRICRKISSHYLADSYYVHFGGCSLLCPTCSSIDSLLRMIPRALAVSGFSCDVAMGEALRLENVLIRTLDAALQLDYDSLLGVKSAIQSMLPKQIESLGFRLLLN